MEVKLVVRTLDLFELFAREARPLSLTELARGLDTPMSSTSALVRTLAGQGYLYETRKRGGYYPTRKMLLSCRAIDLADPLLDSVRPSLEALRDRSNETIVLGRRQDLEVVYLDVVPSRQVIRYNAAPGETRPLASNSIGKALFAALDPAEQQQLAARLPWKTLTPHTITSAKRLLDEAAAIVQRGWADNDAESVPDLGAVAMPFNLGGEWYGVSVVGPLARIQRHQASHVEALFETIAQLQAAARLPGGDDPG